MVYLVKDIVGLNTKVKEKISNLSDLFYTYKLFNLKGLNQIQKDINTLILYKSILDRIIEYNFLAYAGCSTLTIDISEDDEEGTKIETVIGKVGDKLRIKIETEVGETSTSKIIYRDYEVYVPPFVCENFDNIITNALKLI